MIQQTCGFRFLAVFSLLLILSGVTKGEAILSFQRGSEDGAYVMLQNSEPIAAIQFTIHGMSISLLSIQVSDRTEQAGWIISNHLVNDSTMNVVLLRTAQNLEAGSGAIAALSILRSGEVARLSFSRIVVSSPSAAAITWTSEEFNWSLTAPVAAELSQNYPNPFNPSTTIPYRLERPGQVLLTVYDITGREITRMVDQHQNAGSYAKTWTGRDAVGNPVPSGIYFVRLQVGTTEMVKKMVLTR